MTELSDELIRIIHGKLLTPLFQPIISLHQKTILGYEALIRGPSNSVLHSPVNLFDTAERFDLQAKLEFACREITLQHFAEWTINTKLFINVTPSALLEPDFRKGETLKLLKKFGIAPTAVIIEITEHQPTDDYDLMREAVRHYRNMGFKIALDDLGAGYSGLRLWSELQPDYVKIDKYFIQNLHQDAIKLNFVRSIQNMAIIMNCQVIAEGVETVDEFKVIEQLGVAHAQGFYFARPAPQPLETFNLAQLTPGNTGHYQTEWVNSKTAADITQWIQPVNSDTPISEVMDLFQQNNAQHILPLVDNGFAVGIIFRDSFLTKLFSNRYGIELFGKLPIKSFIEKTPLFVDKNTSLEKVSQQLTSVTRNHQVFIITDKGDYAGIGTILDLLQAITQQQIQNAKHANPLTLLPGSVPINEQINILIRTRSFFCVGYFDLDNFKPFNDVYGYSAGDEIIKALAATLTNHVSPIAGKIGHIGGDDFIVVFTTQDWFDCCKHILQAFANLVPRYYKEEDINAGGIVTENRQGKEIFFPLLSLSVGLVDPLSARQCQSHVDIADLASEAKKQAKKIDGNSYFINRRAPINHDCEVSALQMGNG